MEIVEKDEASEDDSDDEQSVAHESDDDIVTIPCPYCRKAIWEESVACEHCGSFISAEDQPWLRPWWLILGVLMCFVCVLIWLRR